MNVFKADYLDGLKLDDLLRLAAGESPLPWCDGDWSPLKELQDHWSLGRKLERVIRKYEADGGPIDEAADLLRAVQRMRSKYLMAWQPTPQQRERAN